MAARAYAGGTTAHRGRRRPAPRRRPAARRGASRVQWDRVGRIALTLVLAAVLYSYLHPAINFFNTYRGASAAKARFHEELRENKRLHAEIQHAGDRVQLETHARREGMTAPGERPFLVSSR
jgi:hypothetical protein